MKQVLNKLTALLLMLALVLPLAVMPAAAAEAVYGKCLKDQVNVRKTIDGAIWFRIDKGHVAEILGEQTVKGVKWYKINTPHPVPNGRTYIGYIMAEFFQPLTASETDDYLGAPTQPAPDQGETAPPSSDGTDHVEYDGVPVEGAKGKTKASANFRTQPSTTAGAVIATLPAGTEVEVSGVPQAGDADGWYRVRYQGKTGYIHASLLTLVEEGEPDADFGTDVNGAKGVITADNVSFLAGPGVNETLIAKLGLNTEVEILTIPDQVSVNDWYRIRHDGKVGFVQSNFVRVTDNGDLAQPDAVAMGVTVNTNGVNFRTGPGTSYASMGLLTSGIEVELLSIPAKTDANHWYKVRYNGKTGYIQAPYIQVLGSGAPTEPDEEPVIVANTGEITSTDGVNFRVGPGTNYGTMGKLTEGTVVELLSIPEVIDENHWYKVRYNNRTGYIQAPFIRVLTVDEDDLPSEEKYGYAKLIKSDASLRKTPGGETATYWRGQGSLMRIVGTPVVKGYYSWYPVYHTADTAIYYVRDDMIEIVNVDNGEITPSEPAPDSPYGYVITTQNNVNIRIKPGEETIIQVPVNVVLTCVGEPETPAGSEYTWYMVRYEGMVGYIRGDCVRVCTSTGGELETAPPAEPDQPTEPDTPEEPDTPDEPEQPEETVYGYIKLNTGNRVNLREKPLGSSLRLLPNGTILPVVGQVVPYGMYGKYTWYPVRTADGEFGYIRGDCVMECDASGNPVESEPETPPVTEPDLTGVTGKILKNTNFRTGTSTDSTIITVIPAGTVVPVLQIPENREYGWYKISYSGRTGYVYGTLIEVIEEEGEQPETPSAFGYIQITGSRVHVRRTPDGTSLTQVDTGTVWPIIGASIMKGGVEWFHVRAGGKEGYVHGGYAFKLSPEQEDSYLNNGTVPEEPETPEDVPSNYLITTSNKLNVRESYSQDSTSVYQVGPGTVMKFFDTKQVGTVTWYSVLCNDLELWVHGNYIKVMTESEYAAWAAQNPDLVPDKDDHLGYLKTNQSNVYIRNAADGSLYIEKINNKGTVMRYYGDVRNAGNADWYRVLTPAGEFGYVRADLVTLCEEDGSDLPLPEPDLGDTSSAPQSQQETSYSTLTLGSTGTKVTNLVNELINQGYYTGKATSSFTSEVKKAVEAFQRANGLTVDGIAGSITQHALFGTRPIGSGDTKNLDFTIYPVEKIDWFTGGIQDLLPRGSNFKVYDVKTGIVWWAHRWAGSKHADIETLTAADSARLCQIYGVKNLAEIVKNNMWERRPCLVTIGTRTFACSLDGMQHNPDGDTIANNGMDGQICLHFTNSMGHSSGAVSTSHAEAIEYAYNNAPAGQKK